MRITTFQIENYKSFLSSEEIQFEPGFNVIVGQNNVGKTAFVEALSSRFSNAPHRSLEVASSGESQVKMSIELNTEELLDLLSKRLNNFYLPIGGGASPEVQVEKFFNILPQQNVAKCIFKGDQLYSAYLPSYSEEFSGLADGTHVNTFQFEMNPSSKIPQRMSGSLSGRSYGSTLPMQLANVLRERIYAFKAERFNIGKSRMGADPVLLPDAANLPGVLNLIQSRDPIRFRRYCQYVSIIFPEIKQITVPPISANDVQINLWSIDPASERPDLSISLSESGTGIGQVLAILYIAVNSDFPRAIIIDEPQSFLHPGAVRKLFDILKQHPQHQYIITTHSPTALAAADAQKLFLIRKVEAKSKMEEIDTSETQEVRLVLSEVGARLSDVFGADNILWVEGRTEEICFPIILSRIAKQPLLGTAVLGVLQTGDFEGSDSERILRIYKKLSEGRAILPPSTGFVFDREGRTDQEIEDIIREGKGKVYFLNRRMYENYLLNPSAIAEVMYSVEGFKKAPVRAEEIEQWFQDNKWEKEYFCSPLKQKNKTDEVWQKFVHGAKVLEDLFKQFSDGRVTYRKIEHGVTLTKWIAENTPEGLAEIATLLKTILGRDSNPQKNK